MNFLEYEKYIYDICKSLGIPENYSEICGVEIQLESRKLVNIGNDIYGRPQLLQANAARSWATMCKEAKNDNIYLYVVSAFRSVNKQLEIIQNKIDKGLLISDILKVNTAPGYSQHHTGRALDLTTNDCKPLSEAFDNTDAFYWLKENAKFFEYNLTYPKNNKFSIAYEPWHWAYVSE